MVKTPKMRHSKGKRQPVIIELEPGAVSRVDATAADEPQQHEMAAEAGETIAQEAEAPVQDTAFVAEESAAVSEAGQQGSFADASAEPPQRREAEPAGYGFDAEEPARSDTTPRSDPPPPPAPQRRGRTSAFVAGIVGGVVALAGGGLLQFAGVLGMPGSGSGNGAVQALQGEMAALKQEVAGLKSGPDSSLAGSLEQLQSEFAALKAAVEQGGGGDGAALEARIKEIESALAGISGSGGPAEAAVAALGAKIAAVENQVKEAAAASESRFGAIEQSIANLTSRVDAQASQPKVALAIATSALKQALERGGPFAAELETFAAIAPDAPEIAALRAHAETGVSTRPDLQADMPEAAKAMIAAAQPVDENAGFFQRLLTSAESLVSVRPIGEVEGPGVPETVARMEVALNAGDLAKAVTEYETLPETVKAAGKDFADRVKARLEVEKLVDQAIAGAMKA